MKELKGLQEERLALAAQLRALADRQKDWTAEDEASWAKINDDLKANREAIDSAQAALAQSAAVQARLAEIEAEFRESNGDGRVGADAGQRRAAEPERIAAASDADHATAFAAWLRRGHGLELSQRETDSCRRTGLNPNAAYFDGYCHRAHGDPAWHSLGGQQIRETRAMSLTGSAGGFTVAQEFSGILERQLLAFGGPRSVCRVLTTSTGASLPWPTVNDTGNVGALLAENTTIGASVDPTFAAVTFGAYKYSSTPVLASAEILQDSAFDIGSLLAELLGERLGRIEGAHTTTGTGSSQPNGIVTASSAGVTAAGAAAIVFDDIMGLIHSVDPWYRTGPNVGLMMHDQVLLAVRKLKDTTNQPLWQPSQQLGTPDRLLGFPVTINQHMSSTIATTLKTMLFGDFSKYVIRDAGPIRFYRLDERYRDLDQTGFIAFKRMDANCIQSAAIKRLTQA